MTTSLSTNKVVENNTWYERIIACTARWSSMIFSSIWPPRAGTLEPPRYGVRLVIGTWLRPGMAREGGGWYAWPGAAPAALLRKNESHDCNKYITKYIYLNIQLTSQEEVTGWWRKLHNRELKNLWSLPTIADEAKLFLCMSWQCMWETEV